MQIFSYFLLLSIILEWSYTESLDFINNLPRRQVEKRLKAYLDGKRKHKFLRVLKSIKPRFRACNTSSAQKLFLCKRILTTKKYNISPLYDTADKNCGTRTIFVMKDEYDLNMFPCNPKTNEQPHYYYISNVGYNEPSPSLLLLKSVDEDEYTNRIRVEARVDLSDIDMYALKLAGSKEQGK